jgi:PTS system galactitol-specific IIA component
MIEPELCVVGLDASSAEGAIRALARLLHAAGRVHATFEAAAVARELRSPTGLPFEPLAVALPHAEPEHVVSPAIAIATLATPVPFREMGTPATQLACGLVVMPAFGSKQQADAELSRLIEALQDPETTRALAAAKTPQALCATLRAKWDEA